MNNFNFLQKCLLLWGLVALIGCIPAPHPAGQNYPQRTQRIRKAPTAPKRVIKQKEEKINLLAPWQVWGKNTFGNASLEKAEHLVELGNYKEAIKAYKEAELGSNPLTVKREAFLRRIGTSLKLGESAKVLNEVTDYVQKASMTVSELDPRVSLVVAYAYYHQGKTEQVLAWLSLSYRGLRGRGITARRAERTTEIIVRSVPESQFAEFDKRWNADEFVGKVFRNEKLRRMQGGQVGKPISMSWFKNYGSNENSYLNLATEAKELLSPTDFDLSVEAEAEKNIQHISERKIGDSSNKVSKHIPGVVTVGVLLPFTGAYAHHAQKVKSGIELALEEVRPRGAIRLVFGDTEGDMQKAVSEYTRLVVSEGAAVILGPMLVKSTEEVAVASFSYNVPLITFTKRRDIPELGDSIFRLGATVKNQVSELVKYASDYLGVKTFSIVYPDTPSGREFALNFQQEVEKRQGIILSLLDYQPSSMESLDYVADELAAHPTQAVFMPDTLERVWSLNEKLRKMELEIELPVFMGPAFWDDPVAIRGYGQSLNGAIYVTPFFAKSKESPVVEFRTNYEAKYDKVPELLGAQAYDASELVFQAAISTDGLPGSIAEALRGASGVRGVTGVLTVTSSGEIERRMSILRMKDGESLEVMSAGNIVGHYPNSKEKSFESKKRGEIS